MKPRKTCCKGSVLRRPRTDAGWLLPGLLVLGYRFSSSIRRSSRNCLRLSPLSLEALPVRHLLHSGWRGGSCICCLGLSQKSIMGSKPPKGQWLTNESKQAKQQGKPFPSRNPSSTLPSLTCFSLPAYAEAGLACIRQTGVPDRRFTHTLHERVIHAIRCRFGRSRYPSGIGS